MKYVKNAKGNKMSVEYDVKLIVGYQIFIPRDCGDEDVYLNHICQKHGYTCIVTGDAYWGHLKHYIVPNIDYHNKEGMIAALNQLDEMKDVLENEDASFNKIPTIDSAVLKF